MKPSQDTKALTIGASLLVLRRLARWNTPSRTRTAHLGAQAWADTAGVHAGDAQGLPGLERQVGMPTDATSRPSPGANALQCYPDVMKQTWSRICKLVHGHASGGRTRSAKPDGLDTC